MERFKTTARHHYRDYGRQLTARDLEAVASAFGFPSVPALLDFAEESNAN